MPTTRSWRTLVFSDLGVLLLLALGRVALLFLTHPAYGWHRDELDMLESARSLAWGYVAYPPLTAGVARLGLELFGPSLLGVRLFAAASMGAIMVLTGLMARDLGGGRHAQVLAAVAAGISPVQLLGGSLLSYSSLDALWWVLAAFFVARLLKTGEARWWLAVGTVLGLGMLTKYLFAIEIAGLVAGVLASPARRYLRSPWLWAGAAVSILIVLPNLVWQAQHGFISLEFMRSIHARDIRIGRTETFLPEQLYFSANLATLPLWIAGLVSLLIGRRGQGYRPLAWMYLVPLVLLFLLQGRSYYLAAAYPPLLAAGAVIADSWLRSLRSGAARLARACLWSALVIGGLAFAAIALPVAPPGSAWFQTAWELNNELGEMLGWPELARTTAEVYASLSPSERAATAIVTHNYGEVGALNLYGPALGLPTALSGMNGFWYRGPGALQPAIVIALGYDLHGTAAHFGACEIAAQVRNPHGILNEEAGDHPWIYLCRRLPRPWPEIWAGLKTYG
jgi:4-amino-4-deoxy-L-arabinose transferase-like glycosyltransferase